MSFAKAQRFGGRGSDVFGSPADYDISIRLGKDYHFGENPKFKGNVTKNGAMSFALYSRSNRCNRPQPTCSTPKVSINKKKMNVRKKKARRRQDPVKNEISSNQSIQECQEGVENENNAELFDEFENMPGTSGSVNRRESNLTSTSSSVNDDSDNLTFSKESDVKSGNRICLFEKLDKRSNTNQSEYESSFRKVVLEKMGKIEKYVKQLRKVLAYLSGKIQTGQMQEQHDKENVKNLILKNNKMSRQNYDEIVKIIADAIRNLRDEFENKRKESLKHIEKNIYQVIENIHIRSNKDTEHMRKICETTTANLIKEIINILNATNVGELEYGSSKKESSEHDSSKQESFNHESFQNDSSEYESSEDFSVMIRNIEQMCIYTDDNTDTYFNYENTCKILSDQLWSSKNELDVLEQEKLDITIKFGDIQKSLEEQESLMDILQTEINKLRLDVTKNV